MSYSLQEKCGGCKKKAKCGDFAVIRGAIDTIHQLGEARGHLGGGTITLDCAYGYEPAAPPPEG